MEFVVADTFEELAEKMGLDAATLSETLTNYNAYCDAGHDPEFGRLLLAKLNAPYCAVRVTRAKSSPTAALPAMKTPKSSARTAR